MGKLRRNDVSDIRKGELHAPDAVYRIICRGDHCDCKEFGNTCRRGFFSLWIQAVYGMYFADRHGLPSLVDFGNINYLYSDAAQFQGDTNFWNYYYQQNYLSSPGHKLLSSQYQEDYPLRIWEKRHFQEINKFINEHLSLQPKVKEYIDRLVSRCQQANTLGIHIRQTDHPVEVEPVTLQRYWRKLKQYGHRFEKFFIATDDSRIVDFLIDEWGQDRIIYQRAVRSQNERAVHTDTDHKDRFRLGLEVLADCYALSSCQQALLVHSNVSYAALLLNPALSYHLLETAGSRYARLKTSLLYWLDQWGLRKM